MSLYSVELKESLEDSCPYVNTISIGNIPIALGAPGLYCIVEKEGNPYLLINIYFEYPCSFFKQDAIIWGNHIAIGFGESFFLIEIERQNYIKIDLNGYFGYLYPYDDFLFVASQSELLCYNKQGVQLWKSEELGVDGVLVHFFDGKYIYGSGEWDPPGGWVEFDINIETGKLD